MTFQTEPSVFVVCLAALLLPAAGCSKKYEHKRLDAESPRFAKVRTMLQELRRAGEDGLDAVLDRQVADGLNDGKKRGCG